MTPRRGSDQATWLILAAVVRRLHRAGAFEELECLSRFSDSELALLVRQEIDEYIERQAA